jgi:hypothetical protein
MSPKIVVQSFQELTSEQRQATVRLRGMHFSKDKSFAENLTRFESQLVAQPDARELHNVVESTEEWRQSGDTLLAGAELIQRELILPKSNGKITVLGLLGVCVHPENQKQGYGRLVVESCFESAQREGKICLFQTDVPEFYDLLKCHRVSNPFVNSKPGAEERRNNWWCKAVMIKGDTAQWPQGVVDLNGLAW